MHEKLIRCFIAIEISDDVLRAISSYINALKEMTSAVRWVRPKAIHLTLKFLGEIKIEQVNRIEEQLRKIEGQFSSFTLRVFTAGCFPNRKNPRVLWLGLDTENGSQLYLVQQWIENQLQMVGFRKEKRKFKPHLTLGRVKKQERIDQLFDYLDKHPFPAKSFDVNDIFLIRSELKPAGAEYTILGRYPL